jgi:hypothetical protein
MLIWNVHFNAGNKIAFFPLTSHRVDDRFEYTVDRRRNERYANCCVLKRDCFGNGGSVLVWAAIAHGFRTNLVVIEGNLNAQR